MTAVELGVGGGKTPGTAPRCTCADPRPFG